MRRGAALVLVVSALAVAGSLRAQCPDGSPPPCARTASRVPVVVPDTHRIAILPFRVNGADTSLGEGIAELLSAEFTGESGPRAIHMGNVIRSYRQAGGNARAPLTQPVAARLARSLGAGYYVDGSIVGLGSRLTVTASVVSALDGHIRHAEPIRGSADSLDVLVARLTTTMLGLAGGESREGSRGVLTASPAAMRDYLEGMAEWRRYRMTEAQTAFERALGEDSTFARAALMRYWIANWAGQPTARWGPLLFGLRDRLSTGDRVLVRAMLGDQYPTPRPPAESFGDRERAANLLPDSPEAQYLAGDWLFHYGGAIDAADALERARGYFAASFALDSQQTVLGHLVDVATMLGDTALLRSLQPALEARMTDMRNPNFVAAGYLGDRAWLGRVRASQGRPGVVMVETMALLPAALAGDAAAIWTSEPGHPPAAIIEWVIARTQGRPEAAGHAFARLPGSDTILFFPGPWRAMLAVDGDTAGGAALVRRLEAATVADTFTAAQRDCNVALWHSWFGDAPAAELPPRAPRNCVAIVELVRAWRAGSPDLLARLESADSLMRRRLIPSQFQGYENIVVARVWESLGNRRRALSAIRVYTIGGPGAAAYSLREEGRLAASLGQVDRALEAYRRYLDYRKDAEPPLVPQRDSVRLAMARLVRQ